MKRKMPKQPKARKLPKKPKHSASITAWRNYKLRHEKTVQDNSHKLAAWKKKCAEITRAEQERQALIKKFSR
jgi:hypothetical protein